MLGRALLKVIIPATLLLSASSALAESRLALVIGQSAYKTVPALPNPGNDAKAMAQLLTDSGFEVVSVTDLSQNQMREKVSEFAGRIAAKGADTVAMIFYAGHGLQIDGENFLVPVDIDVKRESDIPMQAVRVNDIVNTLTSVPSKMRFFLLDACRNNPFPELNKSVGRGLAIVDAKIGAPNTFLSFSTSPGAEAEDGSGANSPYTTALLDGRQGAQHPRRGNLQARSARSPQGNRRAADAVGQFVTYGRFPVLRHTRGRSKTRHRQEDRRRMEA